MSYLNNSVMIFLKSNGDSIITNPKIMSTYIGSIIGREYRMVDITNTIGNVGKSKDERHTSNSKCEVSISDLSFYDSFLNENSIKKIYHNGNFGKDGYTIEQPVAQYDFSSGYKNMIWDESGNLNFIIFNDFSTPKKNVLKEGDVLYLPIRDRGSYGYIGNEYDKLNKENYVGSNSENNYKTLNKLINDKIKDDLSECRFRVVKMEQYFENHAIIVTQA